MCGEQTTTPKKEYKLLQIGIQVSLTCVNCGSQDTFFIPGNIDDNKNKTPFADWKSKALSRLNSKIMQKKNDRNHNKNEE